MKKHNYELPESIHITFEDFLPMVGIEAYNYLNWLLEEGQLQHARRLGGCLYFKCCETGKVALLKHAIGTKDGGLLHAKEARKRNKIEEKKILKSEIKRIDNEEIEAIDKISDEDMQFTDIGPFVLARRNAMIDCENNINEFNYRCISPLDKVQKLKKDGNFQLPSRKPHQTVFTLESETERVIREGKRWHFLHPEYEQWKKEDDERFQRELEEDRKKIDEMMVHYQQRLEEMLLENPNYLNDIIVDPEKALKFAIKNGWMEPKQS